MPIRTIILGCFWIAVTQPMLAQATFEASIDPPEVVAGSRFEVSFALKNGEGSNFRPPAFPGFRLASGPNLSSGMTIINGNYFVHRTWHYELEALRSGKFTIGAAKVTVNGRTLSSNILRIQVVPAQTGRTGLPVNTDKDLFITGELSAPEAWVGQQLTYRVRLYTAINLEGFDIIELPDFQGFYNKEKIRFSTRVEEQNVHGRRYAVRTLHEEAIYAQESGKQVIGEARVRVGIERAGPLGLLGALPMILQTAPVALTVKSLPEPAPEHFSGGVGQYEWACSMDKTALTTDDVLTLTIRLRGNGDPKRSMPPLLTLPAGLEAFEPKVLEEEDYENGQEIVQRKTLAYTILPKEPGDYALRPEWVVFDPDSSRYVTLSADSTFSVHVTTGKNYQANQLGNDSLPPDIQEAPAPGFWQQANDWLQLPGVWAGAAASLALIIFFFWQRRPQNNQLPAIAVTEKVVSDYHEPFNRARQLVQGGNPRVFYDALLRALQSYALYRLQLAPAQLQIATVRQRLADRQVPAAQIQAFSEIWQYTEQALFAGPSQTTNPEAAWRSAEQAVQQVDRYLR